MKKKIFIGIAMSLFAVATVFNLSISKQNKAGDVSLEAIKVMAQAQNSEMINGDATWDDVASALNDWDNWATGGQFDDYYNSGNTYNDQICKYAHAFCDFYDLTGDPVFDRETGIQKDDCDGQSNRC